jgi:excisionase family DNA binding protein
MQYILIDVESANALQSTLEEVKAELKKVREQGVGKEPMTKAQAAKYLHVARSTLDQYISQGAIPVSRYGGRVWVTRGDIDRFIDAHRIK